MMLDSGSLGHNFISDEVADRLGHLPRYKKEVSGYLANSEIEWTATQAIMLPLRLILRQLSFVNMDICIEVLIFPNLNADVIIGAYDMAKYSLFTVNEALLKKFQATGAPSMEDSSLSVLSSLPFIPDLLDDDFGPLAAFPDPNEQSEGYKSATFGDDATLNDMWDKALPRFTIIFADFVRRIADVPPLEVRFKPNIEIPRALKAKVRQQCQESTKKFEDKLVSFRLSV